MRKLFWQINQTLDGFMEGPNRELDLTAGLADPDFDHYASEMLQSIDGMLLGRVTYQLFASYWPSATGPDADRMNQLPKIVFSRTLQQVDWSNSRLAQGDVGQEVVRLKRQPGRDLAVFGSSVGGNARSVGSDRRVSHHREPRRPGRRHADVQEHRLSGEAEAPEGSDMELGNDGALVSAARS